MNKLKEVSQVSGFALSITLLMLFLFIEIATVILATVNSRLWL
jgi:hypothetical protein